MTRSIRRCTQKLGHDILCYISKFQCSSIIINFLLAKKHRKKHLEKNNTKLSVYLCVLLHWIQKYTVAWLKFTKYHDHASEHAFLIFSMIQFLLYIKNPRIPCCNKIYPIMYYTGSSHQQTFCSFSEENWACFITCSTQFLSWRSHRCILIQSSAWGAFKFADRYVVWNLSMHAFHINKFLITVYHLHVLSQYHIQISLAIPHQLGSINNGLISVGYKFTPDS